MKTSFCLLGVLITSVLVSCLDRATDKMVVVPGGTIEEAIAQGLNQESRQVSPFLISAFAVTRADWDKYLKDTNQTDFLTKVTALGAPIKYMMTTPDSALAGVTFLEAVEYCNWRSSKEGLEPVYSIGSALPKDDSGIARLPEILVNQSANGYRLPTVKEWQFAALGGTEGIKSRWWERVNLKEYGSFSEGTGTSSSHPIGKLKPNPLGLFDVIGNTSDWCEDMRPYEKYGSVLEGGRAIMGGGILISDQELSQFAPIWWFSHVEASNPMERQYFGIRLVRNMQ